MQLPHRLVTTCFALSFMAFTGCKEKEPAGPAPVAPKSVATEKTAEKPDSEPEESISQADPEVLLNTWLDSQNERNLNE